MRVSEIRTKKDLVAVKKYNDAYNAGEFSGTEATPIDMNIANMLVYLVGAGYKWIDKPVAGNWTRYDLCSGHHRKYGTNYVYVDHKQKLLRTAETASEFYNH